MGPMSNTGISRGPPRRKFSHMHLLISLGIPEGINHLAGERVDVHPEALERNRPKMDTKVCTSLIAGLQIWRFC